MKTLIEKSIIIEGIGYEAKTIFSISSEADKKRITYKTLDKISGRKINIAFKYSEEETEGSSRIQLSIPFNLNEDEVKAFILEEINKTLA